MQTACTHCGQQHLLKDDALAGHSRVQFRCSKCALISVVELKQRVDATMVISPMPSFARTEATSSNPRLPPPDDGLRLPASANVVLTVMSGPSKGAVHILNLPRVVIGRTGADIVVNDREISRHHCLLEVRDSAVSLKDLDSTNGTFFEEEKVRAAVLQDDAEFRIGTSVIRISLLSK
jgi:DNA segregation ATPase FtsK/SpoIIIE, S-DNA-T family